MKVFEFKRDTVGSAGCCFHTTSDFVIKRPTVDFLLLVWSSHVDSKSV